MVEAIVKNYRQSPRKVRLVADLVRGKKVNHALTVLDFLSKKASDPIRGVIQSAVASAKHNFRLNPDNLYVKDIRVDEGIVAKRYSPRARGSASTIRKRMSHISVTLDTKANGILSRTWKRPVSEVPTENAEDEESENEKKE